MDFAKMANLFGAELANYLDPIRDGIIANNIAIADSELASRLPNMFNIFQALIHRQQVDINNQQNRSDAASHSSNSYALSGTVPGTSTAGQEGTLQEKPIQSNDSSIVEQKSGLDYSKFIQEFAATWKQDSFVGSCELDAMLDFGCEPSTADSTSIEQDGFHLLEATELQLNHQDTKLDIQISQPIKLENVQMQKNKPTKAFICKLDHCGKSFLTKSDLKRHWLTHFEERPYVCKYNEYECIAAFGDRNTAMSHIRAIHLNLLVRGPEKQAHKDRDKDVKQHLFVNKEMLEDVYTRAEMASMNL